MLTKQRIIEILKQANELNNGWIPNWENKNDEIRWTIKHHYIWDTVLIDCSHYIPINIFAFKTRELAEEFLIIIDPSEIKEILNLNQITLLQLLEEK